MSIVYSLLFHMAVYSTKAKSVPFLWLAWTEFAEIYILCTTILCTVTTPSQYTSATIAHICYCELFREHCLSTYFVLIRMNCVLSVVIYVIRISAVTYTANHGNNPRVSLLYNQWNHSRKSWDSFLNSQTKKVYKQQKWEQMCCCVILPFQNRVFI